MNHFDRRQLEVIGDLAVAAGTEISPKFLRKLLNKYFGAKRDE
jgi:hypothetical protein